MIHKALNDRELQSLRIDITYGRIIDNEIVERLLAHNDDLAGARASIKYLESRNESLREDLEDAESNHNRETQYLKDKIARLEREVFSR